MSKITNVLSEVTKIIAEAKHPISSLEIQKNLPHIHRATIYRALNSLRQKQLIRIVELGDGVIRFETFADHHHHLVCFSCKKIEKIDLPSTEEEHLLRLQKSYEKKHGFSLVEHSLEFFGMCRECLSLR